MFTPEQVAFLTTIGCTAQELFDFVDDFLDYGDFDFQTVLDVTSIRRSYFLEVMGGKSSGLIVPMAELPAAIQDALDLVEFATGPADSTWGSVRARMGRPEPFDLRYVCLGNEEHDTPEMRERFPHFARAFREIQPVLSRPRFIEAHRIGPYPARATDVSVVLDLMIHDLDIVALLVGSEVERVEAVGIPVLSSTEDIANARVRFADGCILNLTASRVSLEKLRKIRLFQTDAYISIDLGANKITVVRREGAPEPGAQPKIRAETIELDGGDALLAQDRAFAQAVRERSSPVVSGEKPSVCCR